MKIALVTITAIAAFVGALPANSEIFNCRDSNGKLVLLDTPCPGSRQRQAVLEAPPTPVFPVVPKIDSAPPGPDPFGPVGKAPIYPPALDVSTDTSKRGSYLDRFAEGAVKGVMLIVLGFLYLAVRAFIRKAKNKSHEIKDIQKLLCIGIIAIIIAMAVYPPFQVHLLGRTRSVGYGWIFSQPFGGAASIDIAMLIAQWAIVLGIGAVAFILLWKAKSNVQSQAVLQARKQGSDSKPKAQDAEMCPHCGGPRRDGACWSCGMTR